MEDSELDAARLHATLWRYVLPFDARMLILNGTPATYVRALYAPGDNGEATHFTIQRQLAHALGSRLYGDGGRVRQRFWELLFDTCDRFNVPVNVNDAGDPRLAGNRMVDLSGHARNALDPASIVEIIAAYNEQARPGLMPLQHDLGRLIHALADWMLCEDSEVQASASWLLGARYAGVFIALGQQH